MQPMMLYFQYTECNKQYKIQTRCDLSKFLEIIEEFKPEFETHPQLKHFFQMANEPNRKGMWMLLFQIVCVDQKTIVWFVVNGVSIRYSLREHDMLCGFCCHDNSKRINPKMDLKKYKNQFKKRQFSNKKKELSEMLERSCFQ